MSFRLHFEDLQLVFKTGTEEQIALLCKLCQDLNVELPSKMEEMLEAKKTLKLV